VSSVRVLAKELALEALERELGGLPHGTRCFGCAIASGVRGERIRESEHGIAVLNRFGCRPGHLVVVAREHVEKIHELPWPAFADLQRLAYEAAGALERHYRPVRTYTAVLGSPVPLPMSYAHLHVHVVPVTDARVFSWSEGVVVYDDGEAAQLAAELRRTW
jgi:diadenosine tetraphosphate (Ap4A) HIT family hydrolase